MFLLTLVVAQAVAGPVQLSFKRQQEKQQVSRLRGTEVELCGVCIQFAGEFINQLLNIILSECSSLKYTSTPCISCVLHHVPITDAGVVGACGDLCGALANKVNNKVVGEVCDLLCDIVGIDEFIKLIEK